MPKYQGVEKKKNRFYAHLQYENKRYTPRKGFATAKEATEWRSGKLQELEKGIVIESDLTLTGYIKIFLKDYLQTKGNIKTSSLINIESGFRNVVIPLIGQYKLQNLTPKLLQDFKNNITAKYSSYYAKNILIQLKRSLKRAVIWKYIKENPAADLEIPKIVIEKPVILNEVQLYTLLQNSPIRERALIGLGALAGLRISEILGLQWKYIDFQKGTIRIEYQCYRGDYRDPKTLKSKRTIPIIDDLVPILKEWKLRCPPPKKWLFPGITEKPLHGSSWEKYNFKPLLKRNNLPDVKFHSLRHAFNKMLLDRGMPIREVMQFMGHSDPKITIAVYDRESPKRLSDVSKNIKIFDSAGLRIKRRKTDSSIS